MTVLMYSNCLNLFSNREEKKAMVSLQIAELFVLLRTSGLENSVWDDYQEWLKSKGTALLFLSLFWLKSHLKLCTGNRAWTPKQRGWQMVPQERETAGRWHGLFKQQRYFWLPKLRVGKKEDIFSSVASLHTGNVLAERRLVKDIQLLTAREVKSCRY